MPTIDYLSEDTHITGFALVTIIGPEYAQKNDVMGMKIRGLTKTIDEAKALTKRIMEYDDTCDIYTVEAGKFFPLIVKNDNEIGDIEYANTELNALMKSYTENLVNRNREYNERKKDSIELATSSKNKKENIIVVYNTLKNVKIEKEKTIKLLQEIDERIELENERIQDEYTEDEKLFLEHYITNEVSKEEIDEFMKTT
jgi:RecJ-like exonuclease